MVGGNRDLYHRRNGVLVDLGDLAGLAGQALVLAVVSGLKYTLAERS